MKPVLIKSQDYHATLTTYIYCGMWHLWAAEQQGRDGYFYWPAESSLSAYADADQFRKIPNQFDWYFEQPKIKSKPNDGETWLWQQWTDKCPVPFMAQPLSVIKDYYKKHLKFNDTVNQRGLDLVRKYKIDFSSTIGITWRGTDNVTDGRPRLPIEVYYHYIDEILKDKPDARIMCTAEETTILGPLLARYPTAFLIEEFYSSPLGHKHNPERFSPFSGFERGMQPALMVWLFSQCAYYIKNRSSTGAVASWLSDGKIICLGHPENLGYDKMDDLVEIEGVRYPLVK